MNPVLEKAISNTFFISSLGIEVMGHDMGKGDFDYALEMVRLASDGGWRLPNRSECFALWCIKQLDCGDIKDYYYWTGEYHFKENVGYMFKMDTPFLSTRSMKDWYFVRLVRDIQNK